MADGSTQALQNIAMAVFIGHPITIIISSFAIKERCISHQNKSEIFSVVTTIIVNKKLKYFFLSQFFNSAANGIPGSLFAFFVIHKLQREDLVGLLMLLYLLSGVLSLSLIHI